MFFSSKLVNGDDRYYIVHLGGTLEDIPITNFLKAEGNSIAHVIKYIELDLQLTSDDTKVATHDWDTFREQTGSDPDKQSIPS